MFIVEEVKDVAAAAVAVVVAVAVPPHTMERMKLRFTMRAESNARSSTHLDRVATSEPPLEMLRSTDAAEPPADHDAKPVAHCLALLHAVGRQNDAARRRQRRNHLPHRPADGKRMRRAPRVSRARGGGKEVNEGQQEQW